MSSQCSSMMLNLSSSQTEPGYRSLAALLTMAGPSESVLMRRFRTQRLEGTSGSCSVCAQQELEDYLALQHLNYRAARSRRQKVLSASACARLDGKVRHENVDERHIWKLLTSARSVGNGVSIREYRCPMRHRTDCTAGLG